jgi:hypothetical protein
MATFRKYGGTNFSPISNIVRHDILNSKSSSFNTTGLYNSKEIYLSHIDMSGNSLLHVGNIIFQDGTSISTAQDGPKGSKGDTGPKGDLGDTGPQGVKGEQGDTVPKGDEGDTGPQGVKGEQGDTGPKGDEGDTGPKGDEGDTGPKGDVGDTGPQGDTGPKGDVGDTGPAGPAGDPYTSGNFTVNGNLNVTGHSSMNGKLIVEEDASFNSNVDISGTLRVVNSDSYIRDIRIGYGSGNIGNNLVVGIDAGTSNLSGEHNTFIGYGSGKLNKHGICNTFIGYDSGYSNNNVDDSNQGEFNTFIGYNSGYSNTVGNSNLFIGANSGFSNQSGNDNAFIGDSSGYSNTTGEGNIFIGSNAGFNNDTGNFNMIIGSQSGRLIQSGNANLIFGYETFTTNSDSDILPKEYTENVAMGNSIGNLITGNYNTFVGNSSCKNYDGSYCSFFGYSSGSSQNIGGLGNTLLGSGSNVNADDVQYSTAIGYGSSIDVSNTIVIGRDTETTKIPGNIDISGISTLRNRAYQELNSNPSWNKVNGYYGLAKDAYPALNPYSSGVKAVSKWTIKTASSVNNWISVCWSPELTLFAAVSRNGTTQRVMTSHNGINWTSRNTPNSVCNSICWSSKNGFVVVCTNNAMKSSDGIAWTQSSSVPSGIWSCVCWSDELGIFVAIGNTSNSMISVDGSVWQLYQFTFTIDSMRSICWSAELRLFVAVSEIYVITSNDGQNWILRSDSVGSMSICWSVELGLFVGVNDTLHKIIISSDGVTWSNITNPISNRNWYSVCWSAELGLFACVAYNYTSNSIPNVVMTSPDGINWTLRPTDTTNTKFQQICWSPELGIFVAVGENSSTSSILISSLKGRPPTCYNVFDSSFNSIDQNGNWNLKVTSIENTTNSDLSINSIINVNNNINQTGTTSSTNRIIQGTVLSDALSENANNFKHSIFSYNHGSNATSSPCIVCRETNATTTNTINFTPRAATGFNPIVTSGDCLINSSNNNNTSKLTLTSSNTTTKVGVRISSISSTQTTVELSAGSNQIFIDSLNGITFSSNANTFTTTGGTTFIQKYQSSTHTFTKQDGTDGCNVNVRGTITFTDNSVQSTAWNSTNAGYTKSGSTLTFANNTTLNLTTGSSIIFPDSSTQLSAWNSTNAGYTKSSTNFTLANNLNLVLSGSITMSNGGSITNVGSITFSDNSVQTVAYSSTKNDKLVAVGKYSEGTVISDVFLISNTTASNGSITLSPGTWIITGNICVEVTGGNTTVGEMMAGYSTSPSSFSQTKNLGIFNGGGFTYSAGNRWTLQSSGVVINSSTISNTYTLAIKCSFGTANRLYVPGNYCNLFALQISV